MTPREKLTIEQNVLARFIREPAFEAALRADPESADVSLGVSRGFIEKLIAIDARRVSAFRFSAQHKKALRSSKLPP